MWPLMARASVRVLVFTTLLVARPTLVEAIDIQRVISPGGIEAWLVEDHKNPIITLCQSLMAPPPTPKARSGCRLTANLLDKGAGPMTVILSAARWKTWSSASVLMRVVTVSAPVCKLLQRILTRHLIFSALL